MCLNKDTHLCCSFLSPKLLLNFISVLNKIHSSQTKLFEWIFIVSIVPVIWSQWLSLILVQNWSYLTNWHGFALNVVFCLPLSVLSPKMGKIAVNFISVIKKMQQFFSKLSWMTSCFVFNYTCHFVSFIISNFRLKLKQNVKYLPWVWTLIYHFQFSHQYLGKLSLILFQSLTKCGNLMLNTLKWLVFLFQLYLSFCLIHYQ